MDNQLYKNFDAATINLLGVEGEMLLKVVKIALAERRDSVWSKIDYTEVELIRLLHDVTRAMSEIETSVNVSEGDAMPANMGLDGEYHTDVTEVVIMASGYEWICPACEELNHEIEVVEKVECPTCHNKYDVSDHVEPTG
jgi:hypothetical protein